MKQILFIFCLLPSLLFAATGDVTSVTVRPDGWSVDVAIEGFTSGATYDFDLDTNNVPTSTTPYLTVVSEGYDDTGTLGTITRTVYLTEIVRTPYETRTQPGGTWSGTFVDGETITCSTSGATAVIVGNQSSGASIRYRLLSGTPLTTQTWTGGTSGATFVNTSSTVTTLSVPTKDERVTSTGMVFRASLSDFVFVDDNTGAGKSGTAPTVTLKSGFVVNTGGASQSNAAVTAGAVTNNSTEVYATAPVLGNWSYPPFQKWDATSKLRAVAFERNGQQRRPVRCVKFSATDGTNSWTEIVTAPQWDPSMLDAVPVVEFISTTDFTSSMTQGATITVNFIAYPWVGDASSILDTSTGSAAPSPNHGPVTGVCDKAGSYGVTCALVDDVSGSDAGALTVYDSASFNPATAYKFLTLGKAARAIRDYNNANRSRDRVDAGIIYCNLGTYAWLGATIAGTYGATPSTWITIKPATGVARADVVIDASSGNTDISDRVKFENITITSSTSSTFNNCLAMWFDQCDFNTSGTSVFNSAGQYCWATRCRITQLAQGLNAFSTTDMAWALVRGCDLSGYAKGSVVYTWLGNKKTGNTSTTSNLVTGSINGMNAPDPQSQIIAYNKLYGFSIASGNILILGVHADKPVRGIAVVQNIFESTGTTAGDITNIASSDVHDNINNVLIWNNTFSGERQNFAYNSSGTTILTRKYWSSKNNNYTDFNIKTDSFSPGSGARIGNWSFLYGVGCSGDLLAERNKGFYRLFSGLNTTFYQDWGTDPTYFKYVNYAGQIGTTAGSGDGDYRVRSSSPAYRRQRDCLLPFDINGKPRSANTDNSGAFSEGGVKPASMMFAN